MPAIEHRYGECSVIASVRLRGDQPGYVRGVAAVADRNGREHIALRLAGVLIYLEDRAALEALVRAVGKARNLADGVYRDADSPPG